MADDTTLETATEPSTETAVDSSAPVEGGSTLMTGAPSHPDAAVEPKPDEGAGKAETAKDGEDWSLEVPEGMDEAAIRELEKGCKAIGLSKEQAGKVVDMRRKERDDFERTQVGWQREIMNDPEFGGANYQASVVNARKALNAYDPDGKIRAMLDSTGYGNNPDVIRLFARVGKDMREDKVLNARGGSGDRPLSERFYGGKQ